MTNKEELRNEYWHFYMDIKSKRLSKQIQSEHKKLIREKTRKKEQESNINSNMGGNEISLD